MSEDSLDLEEDRPRRERPIRILSEAPLDQIWTYMSTWESKELARRLIRDRAGATGRTLSEELLRGKAQALAYCMRTAREYLVPSSVQSWPRRVVADYYGYMWLLAGVLAADPQTDYELESLESVTRLGHGLGSTIDPNASFAASELVYVKEVGFFPKFLKYLGLSKDATRNLCPEKKRFDSAAELPSDDVAKLASLDDLLARVPEVSALYFDVTGTTPRNFRVGHSDHNGALKAERMTEQATKGVPNWLDPRNPGFTWVLVMSSGRLNVEFLKEHGPPLSDWAIYKDVLSTDYWHGKLVHSPDKHWHEVLPIHRSAMAPMTWVKPLFGVLDDQLEVHFMLLYLLSILVRYRPRCWREVTEGNLDHYLPLLRFYVEAFERVVPELILEKISGRRVAAVQPGSWNAPI